VPGVVVFRITPKGLEPEPFRRKDKGEFTPVRFTQVRENRIALFAELEGLLQDDESKPTAYAYTRARGVIAEIYSHSIYPLPSILSDGDGGIVLDWVKENRNIRLVIRDNSDLPSYIYHQSGDDYDADYDLTTDSLKKWLDWLISG
jgi:hypothetical protein